MIRNIPGQNKSKHNKLGHVRNDLQSFGKAFLETSLNKQRQYSDVICLFYSRFLRFLKGNHERNAKAFITLQQQILKICQDRSLGISMRSKTVL
jgi:hypothetical protein